MVRIKKHIMKVFCMIMLILIQFDVCGYDLIRALQIADEPVSKCVSAETVVNDGEDMVSEWDDPEYRNVSNRSFIRVPLMDFLPFIFIPVQREVSFERWGSAFYQAKLSNLSYLRYCVLLI